jgi:hypothetical protein
VIVMLCGDWGARAQVACDATISFQEHRPPPRVEILEIDPLLLLLRFGGWWRVDAVVDEAREYLRRRKNPCLPHYRWTDSCF